MKKIILSLFCFGGIAVVAKAQLSIDAASTAYIINFDGTVSGVSNGGYAGNGFSPTPGNGELDSDAWEIDEEGSMLNFGGTENTSGSTFAKGFFTGGSGSTGFQAFEVAAGDTAFGIQPTGGTFTPGYVTLKVFNNTGSVITDYTLSYDVYVYNDNDRGNSLNLSHSTNNTVFNGVTSVDFTSPGTADISPAWIATNKSTTVTGLNIAAASYFYLRWSGADDSGSGARDEFALDNISINATTGTPNDVTAPFVTEVLPISTTEVLVVFSENVSMATATALANYTGIGTVSTASFVGSSMDSVSVITSSSLPIGVLNTLVVSNVEDNSSNNNVMISSNHSFVFNNSNPNVQITEIMYNPPESGSDTLEFIELYNAGTTDAYLGGFSFNSGVTYTFPADTLFPNAFYLLAIDQSAADAFYGITFNDEFSGGLSNGGELLQIVNTTGDVIDSVDYDDGSPWPIAPIDPDGGGASIEIIDVTMANEFGTNWQSGSAPLGTVNSLVVHASPGALTAISTTPAISLVNSTIIVDENIATANVSIELTNANGTPSIVKLVALTGSTANLSDYSMPISLTFPGNIDTIMDFEIIIMDDMAAEVSEYIAIILSDSLNAEIDGETVASVYIKDNDFEAPVANGSIELEPIFTYTVPNGSAEISAYDPVGKRLFVGNSTSNFVEVLDVSNPSTGTLIQSISISAYGNLNSVACWGDTIAVAVENATDPQLNGSIVFLDATGTLLNQITAGAMPDMVTFTPDHTKVLCANEGEPDDNYTNDPEGSISIIDISAGIVNATIITADFTSFNAQQASLEAAGVNIYGPGSTLAQDLEPEYITVDENSTTAWITLQENNALAKLDIASSTITDIYPLGYKDHSLPGNGMDISNDASEILIANWPTKGMYQPDAIASFNIGGSTYLVTANEGDSRDYNGLEEEERIGDGSYPLDSTAYYGFDAFLKNDDNAGRLKTTNSIGDTDTDGDFDDIYSFGARSFSIWDENGVQIYDSGDDFEQITAADTAVNSIFNCSNSNNTIKNRSDDKGPEPEGVTVGVINDTTYAFITLERVGGVMVYDISDVTAPKFVQYINNRDFAAVGGDLAPEGIIFVSDVDSPIDTALVMVSNEVSGTLTIYKVNHTMILPPVADFSQDVNTICEGAEVNFTNTSTGIQDTWEWILSGGTPATSSQSDPTVIYSTPGIYTVSFVVTNVNGTDTLEMVDLITVNSNPQAPSIMQINATTIESSEINGNQWNDNSGIIIGETNQTYSPGIDGDYSVTFTDMNGCSATSPFFTFSDFTGVDEYSTLPLTVYPNPAYQKLSFSRYATVTVIDVNGKIVLKSENVNNIDVSILESGMYTIHTSDGRNIKFIKE